MKTGAFLFERWTCKQCGKVEDKVLPHGFATGPMPDGWFCVSISYESQSTHEHKETSEVFCSRVCVVGYVTTPPYVGRP